MGSVGGPAYAGADIVWATRTSGDQFAVERLAPDRARTTLGQFAAPSAALVGLVASPQRIAVGANAWDCYSGGCKSQDYYNTFHDFSTAPTGGPFTSFAHCGTADECYQQYCETPLEVSGDAVLTGVCPPETAGTRVLDFAAGGKAYKVPDDMYVPRLAGDYLADLVSPSYNKWQIELYNWRTGQTVMTVPVTNAVESLALAPDGTVAYTDSGLFWASPGQPSPHRLPVDARSVQPFAIKDDRIAFHYSDGGYTSPVNVGVIDLAGRVIATGRDVSYRDFDGSHLLGIQRPCGIAAVVEWDLTGDAPRLPPGNCPTVTIKRVAKRMTVPDHLVKLVVSCPAEPRLGCAGDVWALSYPKLRRDKSYSFAGYELDPGETRSILLRLSWNSLCYDDHGRVTLDLTTQTGGGEAGYRKVHWRTRVKVAGLDKRPQACGRRTRR